MLGAGVLLLAAATLLGAGAQYADVVALQGMRRAVLAQPAADRAVLAWTTTDRTKLGAADAAVSAELQRALAPAGGDIARVTRLGWLAGSVPASGSGAGPGADRRTSGVASYEAIERHASLVEGRWPVAGATPIEGALAGPTADALGASVGDLISIADTRTSSAPIEVRLVGTWSAGRDDAYWIGTAGDEADPRAPTKAIVVLQADLLERLARDVVDVEWRVRPAIERIGVDDIGSIRTSLSALPARVRSVVPGAQVAVRTRLPEILGSVGQSILVTRTGILVLVLQFAVLAAYAVLLVGGVLFERRRSEATLLRARGGGSPQIALMAFAEGLLIALPVVAVAPWLTMLLVRVLADSGVIAGVSASDASLGRVPFLVALAAAGACVLGLTAPAVASELAPGALRARLARPMSRTLAQRLGLDVALVALATVGLVQLRLYGAPLTQNARGALGIDPLLVAAPALGLVAGAVLMIRLLPRVAEIGERLVTRRRALLAPLGARHIARRPLRYTRSALLLMLAVALGAFSAIYAATWRQSQADQAAYQAVADVRVQVSDYPQLPDFALGPAYRGVPGVKAATGVSRLTVQAGRAVRDGALVAVDARALPSIADPGKDSSATRALLGKLVDARPGDVGFVVPAATKRVALSVDSDVDRPRGDIFSGPIDAKWPGLRFAATFLDGDGRVVRLDGGDGVFKQRGQRLELPLTRTVGGLEVDLAPPIRLLGMELIATAPDGSAAAGTLTVKGLDASTSTAGGEWTALSLDAQALRWHWEVDDGSGSRPYAPPSRGETELSFGATPESPPLFGGGSSYSFQLWAPIAPIETLPAIAGERFLALSGAHIGDTVATNVLGLALGMQIVGTVSAFPPIAPDAPFLIVDRPTLELASFATSREGVPVKEWWLATEPGSSAAVVETLKSARYSAGAVIGRSELASSLAADPIALGIIGALALGSLAAVAFATIGFIVGATVSTSERVSEFTILRALGLSSRELTTWLTAENAFLVFFTVGCGIVVGIALAWIVLPFATFTTSGQEAVPAPQLVVPWGTVAALAAGAGLLLIPIAVLLRLQLPRVRIADVLRGRDE